MRAKLILQYRQIPVNSAQLWYVENNTNLLLSASCGHMLKSVVHNGTLFVMDILSGNTSRVNEETGDCVLTIAFSAHVESEVATCCDGLPMHTFMSFSVDDDAWYVMYYDGATTRVARVEKTTNIVTDLFPDGLLTNDGSDKKTALAGGEIIVVNDTMYVCNGQGSYHGYDTPQDPTSPSGKVWRANKVDGTGRVLTAYGLRHPWTVAYGEGVFYIADVGWHSVESLHLLVAECAPAGDLNCGESSSTLNYGWPVYEGAVRRKELQLLAPNTSLRTATVALDHCSNHRDYDTSLYVGLAIGLGFVCMLGAYLYTIKRKSEVRYAPVSHRRLD